MKVKEFDSYRAPRRRPWALLVILPLVAGLIWLLSRERPVRETVAHPSPIGDVESVPAPPGASPAPVADAVPPAPLPADVAVLIREAEQFAGADQWVDARLRYLKAYDLVTAPAARKRIEDRLGKINVTLLLSPRQMPEKQVYVVKRGDSLGAIAGRFGTTTALIQKNNMLMNPNLIKVGDRLMVFSGAFDMEANKETHDLLVRLNGAFFKRYRVGTGKFGRTPVGTFVIRDKIAEPTWWPPDGREVPFGHPDNILGTRWMSVRATGDTPDVRGYGIHGTWEPESVGSASSAGCLRMLNAEVEELFDYIPVGTPLVIR